MFELVSNAFGAWREILHVSEWTGLSVGALAGLGALFYFVPLARKLAIAAAVTVLVGWGGMIHGDAVGRADLQKQWDAAKAAATAAQNARDAEVEKELEQKYQPKLADLQKQSDERKARSDTYERQIINLLAKTPPAAGCLLGAAASRVRHGR